MIEHLIRDVHKYLGNLLLIEQKVKMLCYSYNNNRFLKKKKTVKIIFAKY